MPTVTTSKAKKKAKLRNAEYYDCQETMDKLYEDSLNGKEFKHLMELITVPENIKLAYRNLKRNSGSKTSGVDGKTIKHLAVLEEAKLVEQVQKKLVWYCPQAVRRVEIPKGNGKTRPLGIPTIMDRLIQQCIFQVLDPICEAKFHDKSYGFRPERSQEHAIAQCYTYTQKNYLYYVVDIDIKGFFDNVNHGKLLKQMWTMGIQDKKLLSIISVMLKSEIAGIGFPKKGTPQGGIISPLLSNIVLNELDWWLASQWENFPTDYQYSAYTLKNGSLNKGNMYQSMKRTTKLKEIRFVRFADDFKIFCRNYEDCVKIFHATRQWLKQRLGLQISPEKSKIINLKKRYSDFLGFKIKLRKTGTRCKAKIPKYGVISHISDKAIESIKINTKALIKNLQYANESSESEYKELSRYNAYIVGIHSYYRLATCIATDLEPIAFHVQKSLKIRLRNRIKKPSDMMKSKIRNRSSIFLIEQYGKSKQVRYVGGNMIAPIGYVRHKNPMHKKRSINKYTHEGRQEIHQNLQWVNLYILRYLMRNPVSYRSMEYNDNRISLFCAQKGKCAITGQEFTSDNIHCHHKIPIELGGDDIYSNLILLTVDVHRYIHARDHHTIGEYRKLLNLSEKQTRKVYELRSLLKSNVC